MFIYLLIFLATLMVVDYVRKMFHWSKRGLPGPYPSPILGLEFFFQDRMLNLERRKKYGKVYGSYLGTQPTIVVSDPEMVKEITIKQFWNFSDRNAVSLNIKYFKDSFLMKTGNEWKTARARASPVFTTKRIKEIFAHFQKSSKPFFSNIESMIEAGNQDKIDIKDLLKGFQLDVIGKFVYALELNSAKDRDHPFVKNVRKMVDVDFKRVIKGLAFSLLPKFLVDYFEIQTIPSETMEFMASMTRFLIKQREANGTQGSYHDFLDLLVGTFKDKHQDVSEEECIGICCLFFFAGLETVSTTLSNALYCLIMNPQYQEKLYDSLIAIYPNKELSYENIKEAPWLDAVIKESQRMYPAINVLFRKCVNPTTVKGYRFEKDDVIGIDVLSIQNSEDYWPEPEKFRPERFLEKEFKIESDDSMTFLPFGAGPRACIASRMAFIQAEFLLAQIILNFELLRTEHTQVPPSYIRAPQQTQYKSMVIGFRKRTNRID